MSVYNLRPYIGDLPQVGGYIMPPYINTDTGATPFWQQYGAIQYADFTDSSKLQPGAGPNDINGWTDTTTNANDLTQPVAIKQPTYNVDRAEFNANQFLEDVSTNPTGDYTYLIKTQCEAGSEDTQVIIGSSIVDDNFLSFNSGNLRLQVGAANRLTPFNHQDGLPHVVGLRRSGTSYNMIIDGVIVDTWVNATNITLDWLGGRVSETFQLDCAVIALQAYFTALDATQIANVTAELNS